MLYEHPHGFIADFLGRIEDNDRCEEKIERIRWPNGFSCSRCDCKKRYKIRNKKLQCANEDCRYQISLTAGTIFHGTKIPLNKWFLAIFLTAGDQAGISAQRLAKILTVSYKTAHRMLMKLREVMLRANEEQFFGALLYDVKSLIEPAGEPAAEAAVSVKQEPDNGPCKVFFSKPEDFEKATKEKRAPANPKIALVVASAIMLLRRFLLGTYHRYCQKYFPLYLAEFIYRFNEPKPILMIGRLLSDCCRFAP